MIEMKLVRHIESDVHEMARGRSIAGVFMVPYLHYIREF